jgi:arylsulfatase A-like enzyme
MNAIVIVSDTFRRDHIGAYGNPWIRTPNLDRLASQAVVFDGYTSSFPTVQARNDIMTGRYAFTYKEWEPLSDSDVVLSEILHEAGVMTGLVVDTPHPFRPRFAYQRGFRAWEVVRGQENDEWLPGSTEIRWPCDPKKMRSHESFRRHQMNNQFRLRETDYFPARTMSTALNWLEANRSKPFFLYVDTFDPHEPWDPPQHYVEMYDPGYEGEEVSYPLYDYVDFMNEAELRHSRALFAGECSLVDRWVGHLLDGVQALGLDKDTAVFFLADHGYYLGEHDLIGKALISDKLKRSQTLPLYPEVCAVPFIVRMPAQSDGRRVHALAQPADIAPTILDLFDLEIPGSVQSKSLKPVLEGRASSVHDFVVASPTIYTSRMGQPLSTRRSSVIDGNWLLVYGAQIEGIAETSIHSAMVDNIRRTEGGLERTPPAIELYNLQDDPGCERNVVLEYTDHARKLHGAYVDFLERQQVPESHLEHFRTFDANRT